MNRDLLLSIENLSVHFPVNRGVFLRKIGQTSALENVSLQIYYGEILGLIGESGSGKTTLGKAILNILKFHFDGVEISGRITFYEKDQAPSPNLLELPKKKFAYYRNRIQMIFQDPFASLNPRMLVRDIIAEPLRIKNNLKKYQGRKELDERIDYLLHKVGLSREQSYRYPHEFSGGQRQRIGIARCLSTEPQLVIADEPVSALDVSIQAQIINLVYDLQQEFGFTFLFIAHDLSVVYHISNRIAVLYLGTLQEVGETEELFQKQWHPYTRSLIRSTPLLDRFGSFGRQRGHLQGEIASVSEKPLGCPFVTRCPLSAHRAKKKQSLCLEQRPALQLVPEAAGQHWVACHYYQEKF